MVDREATCQWLVKLANILGEEEKTGDEITFRNLKAFHSRILDVMALLLDLPAEPRVMTLEELQKIASIRDGAVWLEQGPGLMPAFMEFAMKDITFFVAVPLTGYRQFFENDWYGKTWRCWTSRPTNEQREAVPWVKP